MILLDNEIYACWTMKYTVSGVSDLRNVLQNIVFVFLES